MTTYKKILVLEDLNLSQDVLESFEFFKGKLAASMKKYDKEQNGTILTTDCVDAMLQTNINEHIDQPLAEQLVGIYARGLNKIDYMQFIAYLIKDSRQIIFKNFLNGKLKRSVSQGRTGMMSKTTSGWRTSKQNFANTYGLGKSTYYEPPVFESFGNSAAKTRPVTKVAKFHTNVNLINQNKKNLDSIEKILYSIKSLMPDIKTKFAIQLDQNISVEEFMKILLGYSVGYPKEKIVESLQFLDIKDMNSFNLLDLDKAINNCKVLSKSNVPAEDIIKIFDNLKDVIFVNGGIAFLFPNNSDSISCSQFVNLLKNKTNYSEGTLESVFYYLVKTDRNFTKEDYKKYITDSRKNFDSDFEFKSMKIIGDLIERKKLKTDEYFDHLLTYNKSTKNKVITRPDFIRILQKEKFKFSAEEIDYIFTYIDYKKDNVIDREEFVTKVCYVSKPLSIVQDIIKRHHLDIEDLCHRMGMKRNVNEKYDYPTFVEKMKKLDYTFSNQFMLSIFNDLKNPDGLTVDSNKIVEEFNVFKKEFIRSKETIPYVDSFTEHYMETMRNKSSFTQLKAKFEEFDQNFTGILPKTEYVKVLDKVLNEFTDEEHMKFIRVTNMFDASGNVRYSDMLNLVYYHEKKDNFTHLCEILANDLKFRFNFNIEKFFLHVLKAIKPRPLTIEEMANYIKSELKDNTIANKTLCKLDVDADGLISPEDLQAVLGRYTTTSYFKYENKESEAKTNLYPSETMKEDKFKNIVKRLKLFMKMKNINEHGLFKKLDKDNDGFISHIDFNYSIDAIIKLAPAIKDQFFNYLDFYHNGLVDLETFIFRFKDFTTSSTLIQNSNQIEKAILNQFTNYLKKNTQLCDTELFSLLDKDCDGIINIDDFKYFVINHLNISKDEFNDFKLERVMQALSLSKNKHIGLSDIKECMNKAKNDLQGKYYLNLKETFKETTNQNMAPNRENLEWISESIERLGMFISEKYNSIREFFDENSVKGTKKFTFDDFMNFHEKNYECFNNGFNLTKDELLAIFSSLDSQKKKYLLLEDLENKLSLFDYYKKLHGDVKNFITQNFYNGIDAFKFFIKNKIKKDSITAPNTLSMEDLLKSSISKKEFFNAFDLFFPKKYSTDTILKYMTKYFKDPNLISFSEFNYVYFNKFTTDEFFVKKRGNETKVLTSREETKKSMFDFKPRDKFLQTPFDNDPLLKIKRILSSSKFDLELFFKAAQGQSLNGVINKFQLRNIIKSLDIGMTNLEIDQIMSRCTMTYDGKMRINDFIKYLKGEDVLLQAGQRNISHIIGEIKQLIYKYYSNPIACFQLNDKDNTLKLDFEKFKQIVIDMYRRDLRKAPNFTLIKNAYDALDLRKDGIIDLNEWTRALGTYNGSLDLGSKGVDNGLEFFNKRASKSQSNFYRVNRKILREWETSGDVTEIYKTIARNKKMIKESLKQYAFNDCGNLFVQTDNLVNVLQDLMPTCTLSKTQWKMICYVGKSGVENLIDLNMFFSMIDMSVKNLKSHPKRY